MSRQINLRSPVREGVRPVFLIVSSLGLAVGLLSIWLALQWVQLRFAESALEGLRAEKTQLEQAITVRSTSPARSALTALEQDIARLNGELAATGEWNALLAGETGELGRGHTRALRSLAAVSVQGVWLQSIDIDITGRQVALEGSAEDYDAIVRYAGRLNQALGPRGVEFKTLDVTGGSAAGSAEGDAAAILRFKLN